MTRCCFQWTQKVIKCTTSTPYQEFRKVCKRTGEGDGGEGGGSEGGGGEGGGDGGGGEGGGGEA
eukprot:scaffold69281_cov66-Phaeocystis_antarctica.AAC.1